jgi:hypothetical protein
MELGDKVKSVTDKLGIKQCGNCKKRQTTLNQISRRGFVGGSVFALALIKNGILKAAWQAAGTPLPIDESDVAGFIRTANNVQGSEAAAHEGRYTDRITEIGPKDPGDLPPTAIPAPKDA